MGIVQLFIQYFLWSHYCFLPLSTLQTKHCCLPDLQNERKQRPVWAGEWVFPHSSGAEPQHRHSGVSQLRTRKTGISSIHGLLPGSENLFHGCLETQGFTVTFFSKTSNGNILRCHFTAHSTWVMFPWYKVNKLPFPALHAPQSGLQAAPWRSWTLALCSSQVCWHLFVSSAGEDSGYLIKLWREPVQILSRYVLEQMENGQRRRNFLVKCNLMTCKFCSPYNG